MLQVVGAGVGRTGTSSLKLALERLLGAPCYHMQETRVRAGDRAIWRRAYEGAPPDWVSFFDGYAATVDWPAAGLWPAIAEAFPDALIVLSVRPVDDWWRSASSTIFPAMASGVPRPESGRTDSDGMVEAMMAPFCHNYLDESAAKEAYLAHNADVRARCAHRRLVEWSPGDGWGPLAADLAVPPPDEPFPHTNTTKEFRAAAQLDA